MKIKIKTTTNWERWRVATFYDKEPETIEWINSFDGGVFWDIGANIGVFSLWCAYKHPGIEVHAFEPMRVNFLRLWENIFMNDYTRITAHPVAMGLLARGDTIFRMPRADTGASGGQIDCDMETAAAEYPVPVTTGDRFRARFGQPSYVKIDTDGNEYDIICRMKRVLADKKLKSVLVEVNSNADAIDDMMRVAGLRPDRRLMACKNRKTDMNVIYSREVRNARRGSEVPVQ